MSLREPIMYDPCKTGALEIDILGTIKLGTNKFKKCINCHASTDKHSERMPACTHAGRCVACGGHHSGLGANPAACFALSAQRRVQPGSGAAGGGRQRIGC